MTATATEATRRDGAVSAPASEPATVLLVDDDEGLRELLRMTLERGPYRIEEAAEGYDALALIARLRPALVFLDVEMPGMDGFEVCRSIKANPATRDVPVVMLTARSQQSDRIRGEEVGADGYLTKPFSPLALLGWLDRLAGLRPAA